jgi:uncharacterized Zn finger protein
MWYRFKPYVSVAKRRANAATQMKKLEKSGERIEPIRIEGRQIARTFWGKAWCDNLESYSDFENRLPRGRTYVRNGSVCDLKISPGCVMARVCGSELYRIKIEIKPAAPALWGDVKRECAGRIGSLLELLQGNLSQEVMQVITRPGSGLFPVPADIRMSCSCPDMARMCKHVAATLYGVGARLDDHPELLFTLRKVDQMELLAGAGDAATLTQARGDHKTIAADALSEVFGIEMDLAASVAPAGTGPTEKVVKVRTRTKKRAAVKPKKRVSKS